MDQVLSRLRDTLAPQYEVERELGRGGMATVYLATDRKHGRQVAVKVFAPEIPTSRGLARFLREIRVTASLSHPHILPLLDSGEVADFTYYVMPYVKGESLRERLAREKQLPIEDVLRLTSEVAGALDTAHASGIVHRDIKPGNILLEDGHAVVADFGIGRAIAELGENAVTASGVALGTPLYMSPEQAGGDSAVDQRSDIYSLGCVVYEMLAGEAPFTGPTPQVVVAKKLSQTPAGLTTYRDGLPERLDTVIRRALSRAPVDRFATAGEFAAALTAAARSSGTARLSRRHVTAIGATALASIAVTTVILGANPPSWWPGGSPRPETLVVLPFHVSAASPTEDSLAVAIADELTLQLSNWDGVIAVPRVSLAGPMFDLGLQGAAVELVADGVRISREVNADRFVGISVDQRGDSAWVTASFFDTRRGRLIGSPLTYGALSSNLLELAAPSVSRIVGLDATPSTLATAARYTRSADAFTGFQEGRKLLDQWLLEEAEQRFEQAIRADSLFAMAHHYLGLTRYWQAARDPGAFSSLGPLIARHTEAAVRNSSELSEGERRHVEAFHAFQHGDFDKARATYHDLVARDSSDVNAWILLGSVEYFDPWLRSAEDGTLVPRSDLNLARRAFTTTVRLSPGFHLGYGHLFDVHRRVVGRSGLRFETPRDELIAPWEPRNPTNQETYFPVALDSIVWLRAAAFDALPPEAAERGAARLEEEVGRLLSRWVAFAPEAARPHEEMVLWIGSQISRITVPVAPARIDSLMSLARQELTLALAASHDTLPSALFQLANLELAVGNVDESLRLVDLGLERLPKDDAAARLAANVLMATGQSDRLLSLYARESPRTRYAPAPNGQLVPYGSSLYVIDRLEVMGAMGVVGRSTQEAFAELSRLWREADYSADQRLALQRSATAYVSAALANDSSALRDWIEAIGEDADPVLLAVHYARSNPARSSTELKLAELAEIDGRPNARLSYLIGLGWQRVGDHSRAVRWFTRVDSVPPFIGSIDTAWGYRSLVLASRAASSRALGDLLSAQRDEERFRALWRGAGRPSASRTAFGRRSASP